LRPTVWLFGSEGQGVSAAADAVAQRRLRIPIDASVESLNVAAAAAVCLFEQARRRRNYM
jgi:TrmH family RNA methyltransferase